MIKRKTEREEDRDEECQPAQRRNEEERKAKGKINTPVLPVIFLLADCINILLS